MKRKKDLPVIGWREWVALPELGIRRIKAKIDTGARSSSLHVFGMEVSEHRDRTFVQFSIHPLQRNFRKTVKAEAEVKEFRKVRSSSGHVAMRPVISATIELLGRHWEIELTLANRDAMGFRMLLGREAIRKRFLVDSGQSFYAGRPKKKRRKKKIESVRKKKKKKHGSLDIRTERKGNIGT
ncbi:ATP-dependent zinc protease [Acidobacteriota bacterium]